MSKLYQVSFDLMATATIQIEALNEEDARVKASEILSIKQLTPDSCFGAKIGIVGFENNIYVDSENGYDKISEVIEI